MKDDAHILLQRAVNVEEWIAAVISSAEGKIKVGGMVLPSFPPAEVQRGYVGESGSAAMAGASKLYRLIHTDFAPELAERPLRILDFGCGWGRFLYFFLRDTPTKYLYGVDPQREALMLCKRNMPKLNYIEIDFLPPLPFRSAYFDLVIANSVFSHLPELSALQWAQELFRIIKPGAALVLTSHAPEFIDDCAGYARGEQEANSEWHRAIAASWLGQQPDEAHRKYRAGQYVYAPTGGAGMTGEFYGDAIIPASYIERHWNNFFAIQQAILDRSLYWQSVFALRRAA